ncbi:MAG: DNA repair protein RadA, partial [Actinobacteria bacterium]|nr:DNA repair protein RadA [Actinomycetota bacterium]
MSRFGCSGCGYAQSQWFGKCPECGAWNAARNVESSTTSKEQLSVVPLDASSAPNRLLTGIAELDRVLG